MNHHPRWNRLRNALREAGVAERPAHEDRSAPHGFAGRVVARSFDGAHSGAGALVRWRRWSLRAAFGAVTLFLAAVLLESPPPVTTGQFVPIPAPERLDLRDLALP